MNNLRDWSEFSDQSRFRGEGASGERLVTNLKYYSVNYAVLGGVIAVAWSAVLGGLRGGVVVGAAAVLAHAWFHLPTLQGRVEQTAAKIRSKFDQRVDSVFHKVDEALKNK